MEMIGDNSIKASREQSARVIQKFYREYAAHKQQRQHNKNIGIINELENEIIEISRKLSDQKEYKDSTEFSLRDVGTESLVTIISFLGGSATFFDFMVTCKHVHKVFRYNIVWNTFLEQACPSVIQHLLAKNSKKDSSGVNLKTLLKAAIEGTNEQVTKLTADLKALKDQGNEEYKKEDYEAAVAIYNKVSQLSGTFKSEIQTPIFELLIGGEKRVELLHLICVLNSNAAQAYINLEKWISAYNSANRSKKYINLLKDEFESNEAFEKEFGLLLRKIEFRLLCSRENISPLFRYVRYSDEPVVDLKVGTLLIASDNISGDIFCDSKVLIYEFDRETVESV